MKNLIKILSAVYIVFVGAFLLVESVLLAEILPLDGTALVVLASIIFGLSIVLAVVIDYSAGGYKCKKCGHNFRPTLKAYVLGPHTVTKRYLKCPKCGEKSFCERMI